MNINDYILEEIKNFTFSSLVKSAQKQCKDFPISHIFIVENNQLMGCFLESDIQTMEHEKVTLAESSGLVSYFFADIQAPLLDVIKLFAEHDCNRLPVIDTEKNYVGYYDLSDILDVFIMSPFLHNLGFTLIVEQIEKDYSISQISQIVESNGGKILGLFISEKREDIVQVTLRVSSEDIHEITQTFRRYNYQVVSKHENDDYLEDLKSRSDYLQKYLEM
jgi:CBS domain-containing protein